MASSPIKVLLVEDSPIALAILKRILDSTPEINVVGTARTGKEGLALIPQVLPDVICTDLHMPQMDGLEFTREVMATRPKPILVISASVQQENTQNVFQLLQAGAVDIFPKPRAGLAADYERAKTELISKIKVLSGVTVFTQHRRPEAYTNKAALPGMDLATTRQIDQKNQSHLFASVPQAIKPEEKIPPIATSNRHFRMLTIGASTGGPQALHTILTSLPANFSVPVVCIQHISEGFLQGMVDWLATKCQMPVKIAPEFELPRPGNIYFAPERRHLEFDTQGRFIYVDSPPVGGHRPSITVTFKSVARIYNRSAIGVLLTGMGRDGADGMSAIARSDGLTIAQDEASCVVFGMPKEAIALNAAQYVLSIGAIAPMLLSRINSVDFRSDSPPPPRFWQKK